MRNKVKFAAMVLSGALLCSTAVCAVDTVVVSAASTYVRVPDASEYEVDNIQKTPVKYGNYYFKANSNGKVRVSASQTKGYKTLDIYYHSSYTDGKAIYGVDSKNQLCKYTLKTGKKSVLVKFSVEPDATYSVGAVYKNYVYITRSSYEDFSLTTYLYNTKTKKCSKVMKNCAIDSQSGAYVAGHNELHTDVSAGPMTLYKINSDGKLTKVKQLAKKSFIVKAVDGKFYYSSYTDDMMNEATLYRCDANGKNKEALVTTKGDFIFFDNITANDCEITKDGRSYTYYYGSTEPVVYRGIDAAKDKEYWSMIYSPEFFKVSEENGKAVFTYQGESTGVDTISISYLEGQEPKAVLEEKVKGYDAKVVGEMDEGYFGANEDKGYTRVIQALADGSKGTTQLTTLGKDGGTVLMEITVHDETDEERTQLISDLIAGLVGTFELKQN